MLYMLEKKALDPPPGHSRVGFSHVLHGKEALDLPLGYAPGLDFHIFYMEKKLWINHLAFVAMERPGSTTWPL